MSSKVTWSALESNPETINPFLAKIGVSGVECVDVFSFEDEFLPFIPTPQYALILCFPDQEAKEHMTSLYSKMADSPETPKEDVFFMKQKIGNACGTFALFHSLANLEGTINIGEGSFRTWLEKAKTLDEDDRSGLLQNDGELAAAHEETAASGETDQPVDVEYHFICYVARNGQLFEIDSSAPCPRPLGMTSSDTLVKDAGKVVQELVESINSSSFSAMALVGSN